MAGTMLDAGAVSHVGSETGTEQNAGRTIPAPHFRCKPKLTLEVLQADNTSRLLTVDSEQCFIGSDEDCELRLVHPEMPPVAAVIRVVDNGFWIESCRKSRDLLVNHETITQSWIKDGDEIEIAPFVLKAHLGLRGTPAARAAEVSGVDAVRKHEPIVWEESELAGLSASELLDRIEADINLIERDEQSRRMGEDTLLRAIRARQAAMLMDQDPAFQSSDDDHPAPRISIRLRMEDDSASEAEEPRNLISDLGQLIGDLNTAIQKLSDTAALAEAGVDIESLLGKLQSLESPKPTEPPRAIA